VFVVIAAGSCPFQASAEEGWIADKNGCKIANPSPRPKESVTWNGGCVGGFADGNGLMQWYLDGVPSARYQGNVHQGVISGNGRLSLPDGATYDGEWVNGKQHGRGTLTAPDGSSYAGEWKDGEPDGHGTMKRASGETVTGNWKQGSYVGPDEDKEQQ
jgi:hypothetical protein